MSTYNLNCHTRAKYDHDEKKSGRKTRPKKPTIVQDNV